uniref:Insulin-like domain-containing protein n=1 Tax=Clytia hemisphaerica TaxID=252671 RepID=A0A7M5VAI0_9CNID|eukprot:TCONS_00029271-protein
MGWMIKSHTIIFTICILATCLICRTDGKGKQGIRMHLCGAEFVKWWTITCRIKQKHNYITKKEEITLGSNKARQFLMLPTRKFKVARTQNAQEECCNEGCTVREIIGYNC